MRADWKHAKFLYDDFASLYLPITNDIKEIEEIWHFDRSLTLLYLDYILLGEQLLKATLVNLINEKYPNLNQEFKVKGIQWVVSKYPFLRKIDHNIFAKAKAIAEEKLIGKLTFGLLVNYLSLNALKGMLEKIGLDFFKEFMGKINNNNPEPFDVDQLMRTIHLMHFIRNIGAHNGQLFQAETIKKICFYTKESPAEFTGMLKRLLYETSVDKQLMVNYNMLIDNYKFINTKYRIWK